MPVVRFAPVLAFIALLAGPLAAGAQTPPPPGPAGSPAPMTGHYHRHHRHDSLAKALRSVNLTPAQQQQIATFRDQTKKANANADEPTRKANAAKLRDEIMSVLTPDQKAQVTAQMQAAKHAPDAASQPSPAPSPASH
jgi:Spy/CpxP family protein refolding chaperone